CSCPYDYAGDCKHVVAVLLTVTDRFAEFFGEQSATDTPTADVEGALADADAETMRAFLRDVLTENPDLRERFLATVGDAPEKRVTDYKQEIERDFDIAAGPHGLVEYDTRLDFTEYYDVATAHEEAGEYEQAARVYRALAETIQENLDRIEDASGHYPDHVRRAINGYVACVHQQDDLDTERRREYLDVLVDQYVDAELDAISEVYDDALRTLCQRTPDYEYLRARLESYVATRTPVKIDAVEANSSPAEAVSEESEATAITDPTPRLDVEWF
ncbi:SWIM zinc finger family protein, partial [Halarchaeum acidiphilum]|uniref:SWIM zinc finger family protein n=1 Tax=Halarchaeum acidiphilum TaxID=489138 RepID=UPI000369C4A7